MLTILWFLLLGLIAGAIARLLVPGPNTMGIAGTMLLGVLGSFIGGFLYNLFFAESDLLSTSGLIGSVIGAILLLLLFRMFLGSRASPSGPL